MNRLQQLIILFSLIGFEGFARSPQLSASFLEAYGEVPAAAAGVGNVLERADGSRISTPEEWLARREEIRQEWLDIIGHGPENMEVKPLTVTYSVRCDSITRYTVECEWLPDMVTTGYLLVPDEASTPSAAVITLFYEPETAVGLGTTADRDFALQLARRGLITLSLGTTETTRDKTYGLYYPSIDSASVQPLAAMALAAANACKALALDPRIDAERIGVMGHSYGGKWAMFASCLYDCFACAAWGDPGLLFDETKGGYINYWEPWYLGYYPPPWTDTWNPDGPTERRGAYGQLVAGAHNLHELHALMAPRPFLVSGGYSDGADRLPILMQTAEVYSLLGEKEKIAFTMRPGHAPTPEANAVLCDFFIYFLTQPVNDHADNTP